MKVSFYEEVTDLQGIKFVAAITEFNDYELQEIMDVDLLQYGWIIQTSDRLLVRFKNEELFMWYKLKWL